MPEPGPAPGQRGVWERIGASFDRTRTHAWEPVTAFLAKHPGRALDLMCGNGRHLRPGDVGLDWSRPLLQAAAGRAPGASLAAGDAANLPFRDGAFAAAVCVAALHGLPTPASRLACLRELRRVTAAGHLARAGAGGVPPSAGDAKGGAALVTVWDRNAGRFADRNLPAGPCDLVVPWRGDGHSEERFYHLFTPASLRQLCEDAGWCVVAESAWGENLVVELA